MDLKFLRDLAIKTIADCTFEKRVSYFGKEKVMPLLLPSGDEKYISFWVRDCAMMAESGLIPDSILKSYIEIIALCGQNGKETLYLENNLIVPPYAVADHINYDGNPVFYPGTYESGKNQGDGTYGIYPPFCDNYYFIMMVGFYIEQSGDKSILQNIYRGLTLAEILEHTFVGYNIDAESALCLSEKEKFTVDWGFVDAIKKSGELLMASILRYNASKTLEMLFENIPQKQNFYKTEAEKIKNSILEVFYDENSGWFYSATGLCKQHDIWATAYAVYSGISAAPKIIKALKKAYEDKTAVVDGYVRHILTTDDFAENTAWESTILEYNTYQNGGYWATPTGWYAYAISLQDKNLAFSLLRDFENHTKNYEKIGAPFEWINENTTNFSGLKYGTSGVLPYIALKRILI
ncbi:MAG: hypothetical protein IKD04_08910 [Clostridia bacterium]|nr:hypothetical protein [Clostridia bacterium]